MASVCFLAGAPRTGGSAPEPWALQSAVSDREADHSVLRQRSASVGVGRVSESAVELGRTHRWGREPYVGVPTWTPARYGEVKGCPRGVGSLLRRFRASAGWAGRSGYSPSDGVPRVSNLPPELVGSRPESGSAFGRGPLAVRISSTVRPELPRVCRGCHDVQNAPRPVQRRVHSG